MANVEAIIRDLQKPTYVIRMARAKLATGSQASTPLQKSAGASMAKATAEFNEVVEKIKRGEYG